jgi:hypothetical protein
LRWLHTGVGEPVMESNVTRMGTATKPAIHQAGNAQRALDRSKGLRIDCRVLSLKW